jgi:hypothetical protein
MEDYFDKYGPGINNNIKKGLKLTTVFSAVNNNPQYYMFIPKQILFWKHFQIRFIAVFVGEKIPDELLDYKENIILWNHNSNLNSVYVAQNIRIYYPALLNLPENEIVMITDMDMLPTNDFYYKSGLENYEKDDFIYYRYVDNDQIFICYNAANSFVWSNIFNIKSELDIQQKLSQNYLIKYSGNPKEKEWFIDQKIMYTELIKYPKLKILNRPIRRLEMYFLKNIMNKSFNFINNYDDAHFHRDYFKNLDYILYTENQLINKIKNYKSPQNGILNKFTFYHGVDIINNDLDFYNLSQKEIAFFSCLNRSSDGFNTLGFLKKNIDIKKLCETGYINKNNQHGIFVKNRYIKKKKVLTFSLWGNIPKYTIGAIKNAELAKHFYPDFECWFYIHDQTVPKDIIYKLSQLSNVKIILKNGDLNSCKPMMWRFEAIDDENVEIMLSRDTDTRILLRERFAVEEWMKSDYAFHIMRDHPHHNFYILGGMFGTRKINGIKWSELITKVNQISNRDYDQQFLVNEIYPLIKDNAMIHASFHKYEKDYCLDFPIDYTDECQFVGEYVMEDDGRPLYK